MKRSTPPSDPTPAARVAIYARVSTPEQSADMQLRELRAYALTRFQVKAPLEFVDEGWKGTARSRPKLDRLMLSVQRREIDAVLVWRFDRFARSSKHLVESLETFNALGVKFFSFSEAIDTATPMGQAMFTIIAAMAQLERDIIRERSLSGMRLAQERDRSGGARLGADGKPRQRVGRPRRFVDVELARMLVADGLSLRAVARNQGWGYETLRRRLQNETAR